MTITIPVKFEADASDLNKEIDQAVGSGSKAGKALRSAAVPAAAALAGLGAAAIKFGNAAADDAKSQSLLALALKNNAGASKAAIAATEDFITAQSKAAAVSDDELRPALAALVQGTGNVEQAQSALKTALDISAQTGKPLATVSAALAKGYGGQTTALGRLVPGLDKAAIKAGDMTAIMAQLADKTGGAAATAADTAAGKTKAMQIAMDEAQESIGSALLPVMAALSEKFAEVADFVAENSKVFLILGGIIGGLAATVLVVNGAMAAYAAITTVVSAATKVWSGIQAAFNLILAANPIVFVVAGIIALIAVIVLVATKTEFFQTVWEKVWGAIKTAFTFVFEFIKNNWPLILAILTGPIGLAVLFIVKNFDRIKEVISAVWEFVKTATSAAWEGIKTVVVNGITTVVDLILGIPKAIIGLQVKMLKAGADLMGALFEGIKSGVSAVGGFAADIAGRIKDAINDLLNLPLTVGPLSVLGKQVLGKITLIPEFAGGTDFAPGGFALVGEQGPELVNLPRGSQVTPADQTRDLLRPPVEITVNLPTGDPEAAAMSVLNRLAAAGTF